jgi:aspartate/methionine/tyrosine aminotransferase
MSTRENHGLMHGPGVLDYRRSAIEKESPEQFGYDRIKYNLSESSVTDLRLQDLSWDAPDLDISYGDHLGLPELRSHIAREAGGISPDQVLVTAGAAAALFIAATSLLKPGDHLVVLHPNYVTNVETPRAVGCRPDYLRLTFETGFRLDIDRLQALIRPETRLVSLTYPHNPTGTHISEADLRRVIALVEGAGCFLLLDETYREMASGQTLPTAASLSRLAISVSSCSKSFGLPGLRLGWLITQDASLFETFLAAKEQIFISNSVVDEKMAARFFTLKGRLFPKIQTHIDRNFQTMKAWIEANEFMEWVEPSAGCVCFPRIKESLPVHLDRFYALLLDKYKTFVGPGHWFEMDRRYMRIGYGWPTNEDLRAGLESITRAIGEAIRQK